MNYWIFQGKPEAYDFTSANKNNLLNDWNVKAHKDKISAGDKAIIWLTGKNAGCYALADIIDNPKQLGISEDNHLWNVNDETGRKHKAEDKDVFKVRIDVTHDLFGRPNKPLLKGAIPATKGLLEKLKKGIRGTNFASSKEEYELVRRLIESR